MDVLWMNGEVLVLELLENGVFGEHVGSGNAGGC